MKRWEETIRRATFHQNAFHSSTVGMMTCTHKLLENEDKSVEIKNTRIENIYEWCSLQKLLELNKECDVQVVTKQTSQNALERNKNQSHLVRDSCSNHEPVETTLLSLQTKFSHDRRQQMLIRKRKSMHSRCKALGHVWTSISIV